MTCLCHAKGNIKACKERKKRKIDECVTHANKRVLSFFKASFKASSSFKAASRMAKTAVAHVDQSLGKLFISRIYVNTQPKVEYLLFPKRCFHDL